MRDSDNSFWVTTGRIGVVIGIIAALITIFAFFHNAPSQTEVFSASGRTPTSNMDTPQTVNSPTFTVNSPTSMIPTATFAPTATISPAKPGTVLYHVSWPSTMNGWTGASQWSVLDGLLVCNGSTYNGGYSDGIFAPFQPQVTDYAIEARIRVIGDSGVTGEFGLFARLTTDDADNMVAYFGGVTNIYAQKPYQGDAEMHVGGAYASPDEVLSSSPFTPASNWHTYRLTVKGTTETLSIDGSVVSTVSDARYLQPGKVGITCENGLQLDVSSFSVIAE